MHNLKKNMLGSYNAGDVDKLLSKVRIDYEKCLKEQKERILKLRDENKVMAEIVEQYKSNERLLIGAMTRAEATAQSIIGSAEKRRRKGSRAWKTRKSRSGWRSRRGASGFTSSNAPARRYTGQSPKPQATMTIRRFPQAAYARW